MIEIRKIKDNEKINELVHRFSLKFSSEDEIVALFDSKEIYGFIQYSVYPEYYCLKYISDLNNDFSLLDGLMKTIIFYADLSRVRYIRLHKHFEHFAKMMHFEDKCDYYEFDILNADKHLCNCEKEV